MLGAGFSCSVCLFVHPCLRCITILPFSHFLFVSCIINDEECLSSLQCKVIASMFIGPCIILIVQ